MKQALRFALQTWHLSFIENVVKKNFLKRFSGFGSLLLLGLQALVVVLTFAKEVLLTSLLGLGSFMDAYVLVNNFLIFSRSYFEQVGFGVLLPVYTLQSFKAENSEASRAPETTVIEESTTVLLSSVVQLFLLLTLALGLIVVAFHANWVNLIAPGWSVDRRAYLTLLLITVVPACLMVQSSEALRTIAIQQKRFGLYQLPRMMSLLTFIGLIGGLFPVIGITAILVALPAGQLIELVFYWFGLNLRWQKTFNFSLLGPFFKKLLPVSLIWGMFYSSVLVDNYFLALLNTGEPSAYRYAFISVLIIASLTVVNLQLTHFSEMNTACTEQDMKTVLNILKKVLWQSCLWSLPIIAIGTALSPWLIQCVFERGAFNAHDTVLVSKTFQIVLWLLPFNALWRLVSTCYFNLNLIQPIILIGIGSMVARIGMNALGVKLNGLMGFSLFSTLNSYLLLAALLIYLFLNAPGIAAPPLKKA